MAKKGISEWGEVTTLQSLHYLILKMYATFHNSQDLCAVLNFQNWAINIPLVLMSSLVKIWGKLVKGFMSYDYKIMGKNFCILTCHGLTMDWVGMGIFPKAFSQGFPSDNFPSGNFLHGQP